jgi:hypothetical protein
MLPDLILDKSVFTAVLKAGMLIPSRLFRQRYTRDKRLLVLHALNIFFYIFHSLLIGFIAAGWVWRPLRRWHLGVCLLTVFSWAGLGLRYGFGYCLFTHGHWVVLQKLGHADLPRSYIKLLLDGLTGLDLSADLVDGVTVSVFAAAWLLSLALNIRDWKQKPPPV